MTPQEAKSRHQELMDEEVNLYITREAKMEQREALDEEIQKINARLKSLRAAREGYTLAEIANKGS